MIGSELSELAKKQLHLIVAGDWSSVNGRLLGYLEEELGAHPSEDPVGAAFCLLKLGIPAEKAVSLLNWREFEAFCLRGLQLNGMEAISGVRFGHGSKRYEIDVLGLGDDVSLLLECKMWSMKTRFSKILSEVKKHMDRTLAFCETIKSNCIDNICREHGRSFLVPIIVSWLNMGPVKFEGKVALVSLSDFPKFLNILDEIKEDFIKLDYRITLKGAPSRNQLNQKY